MGFLGSGPLAALALSVTFATSLAAQARDTAATRLAGGERWKTDFARRTVPSHEIISGGPPKGGIPALDRPRFESAAQAGRWLNARDPLIVVEHGSEVRAYPLSILMWHEIVNDQVGGRPVAVTFCPLCNTAIVFDRRFEGRLLDFGTTGRLRHSDLVMYDRQTETWWQQATGEGIVGVLAGRELQKVPSTTLAWREVRSLHPRVKVLSRETGYARPYGRNPYVGYDRGRRPLAEFFSRETDARLPPMERVVALELGSGWSVPFGTLRKRHVVDAVAAGVPFTVFWAPGAASALDAAEVARGQDIGQTGVFDRRVEGRTLTFLPNRGGFMDRQTGSRWDLAGRAISGPLRGRRLRAIPHGNHFWFAWVVFRPRTIVWEP